MKSKPAWLKTRYTASSGFSRVKRLLADRRLNTVCEQAACPNICECFTSGTATFMILGDVCTRNCRFCGVQNGPPPPVDHDEPSRVAQAVAELQLDYAVVTSVTRDDLADGGASAFARTVGEIKEHTPGCRIELLVPDFRGDEGPLRTVLASGPDVLGHNIETVPRLYPKVRPQADYVRSLGLLENVKKLYPEATVKSGVMVGLGEMVSELMAVFKDLRDRGCDILTIGQYLSPSSRHLPIRRYYAPEEFSELRLAALALGFRHVESGPLVRSSYHASRSSAP